MNKGKILHECTVSWGMLYGEDTGGYINELVEKKKIEVRLCLEACGFTVKDQHFAKDCEWGTLYTWAECKK